MNRSIVVAAPPCHPCHPCHPCSPSGPSRLRGGARLAGGLAAAGAAAIAGSSAAGVLSINVVEVPDLIPGTVTYRIFADFSDPSVALVGIAGENSLAALRYETLSGDGRLVQNAPGFAGLQVQDVPFSGSGPGDSWVSIGGDWQNGMSDTLFSPGFLGGVSGQSVIQGSFFEQRTNGGYFDPDVTGTPETGSVIFAQFTVDAEAVVRYSGSIFFTNDSGVTGDVFSVTLPGPGGLPLLAAALGAGAGRRRRGGRE